MEQFTRAAALQSPSDRHIREDALHLVSAAQNRAASSRGQLESVRAEAQSYLYRRQLLGANKTSYRFDASFV